MNRNDLVVVVVVHACSTTYWWYCTTRMYCDCCMHVCMHGGSMDSFERERETIGARGEGVSEPRGREPLALDSRPLLLTCRDV